MTTRKPTAKASGIRPRRRNGHSPTTTSPTAVLVRIERKTHERPRFPLFILYPSVRTQPDKQKQWRGDQKRSWLSLPLSVFPLLALIPGTEETGREEKGTWINFFRAAPLGLREGHALPSLSPALQRCGGEGAAKKEERRRLFLFSSPTSPPSLREAIQ